MFIFISVWASVLFAPFLPLQTPLCSGIFITMHDSYFIPFIVGDDGAPLFLCICLAWVETFVKLFDCLSLSEISLNILMWEYNIWDTCQKASQICGTV